MIGDKGTAREVADQAFVDRRAGEVEVLDVLGQRLANSSSKVKGDAAQVDLLNWHPVSAMLLFPVVT